MRLKKEILLFYVLIIASAGIIIAADQPSPNKPGVKCCKINRQDAKKKTTPPLYYISEGILRFKA
ncbi:MAG: hypothetical protein EOO13_09335 [Chitinophagaceae bacterium]|nr:MAG: hypothetical protein EOO13_09335 [Chitinophagaceae bacterium]